MTRMKAAGLLLAMMFVSMALLTPPVSANPATRLESVHSYLNDHYDTTEGGYSLKAEKLSRAEPTFSALFALNEFGDIATRPPSINLTKTKEFINHLQWTRIKEKEDKYGGFSSAIAVTPSVMSTYYALRAWQILSLHNDYIGMTEVEINETAALVYLNRTFTDEGSFASNVGEQGSLLTTYMAVYSIDYLARLIEEEDGTPYQKTMDKWLNESAVVDYVLSCQSGDAFKPTPDASVPGVTPTAAALLTLDILDRLNAVGDLQGVRDWLLARQVVTPTAGEYVGGFTEGYLTNDTNLMSTYYALKALDVLNAITNYVNVSLVEDFVISCQAADGAWALSPDSPEGETTYIGIAIEALTLLPDVNVVTALSVEDPNNRSPPAIDWRWIAVAVPLVLALVAGLVALRLD